MRQETHYEIRRNFEETNECDIYSHYNKVWNDYDKEISCNENCKEYNYFSSKEEAEKVFEEVKNDKTEWTKNIILVEVIDTIEIDEDGEEDYIDCSENIIKKN